jgi:hypothetical protein
MVLENTAQGCYLYAPGVEGSLMLHAHSSPVPQELDTRKITRKKGDQTPDEQQCLGFTTQLVK